MESSVSYRIGFIPAWSCYCSLYCLLLIRIHRVELGLCMLGATVPMQSPILRKCRPQRLSDRLWAESIGTQYTEWAGTRAERRCGVVDFLP